MRRAPRSPAGGAPMQVMGAAPRTGISRGELRALRARAANRNGPVRFRALRIAARMLVWGGVAGVLAALALRAADLGPEALPPDLAFAAGQGFLIAAILAASLGAGIRTVLPA